ncbi:hypothetical protein A2982_00275 [candidate division WWE3 bacterium RIFCSPLOWO2_01_FULL_39_13]|uniref:Uncharacterized protein n=1 Tax=candidate division WWE3 bacterium RIFCSPLOWO2_01_FULL_39_13 TaxID=1802624 RepID=A0A1F4V4P7_UNCKA|nr:MAG: hypothetical protein A2982_00275 [candidate division WWE3 bacterium RIFCSPLOWO2_01_FULL_39_13]
MPDPDEVCKSGGADSPTWVGIDTAEFVKGVVATIESSSGVTIDQELGFLDRRWPEILDGDVPRLVEEAVVISRNTLEEALALLVQYHLDLRSIEIVTTISGFKPPKENYFPTFLRLLRDEAEDTKVREQARLLATDFAKMALNLNLLRPSFVYTHFWKFVRCDKCDDDTELIDTRKNITPANLLAAIKLQVLSTYCVNQSHASKSWRFPEEAIAKDELRLINKKFANLCRLHNLIAVLGYQGLIST